MREKEQVEGSVEVYRRLWLVWKFLKLKQLFQFNPELSKREKKNPLLFKALLVKLSLH